MTTDVMAWSSCLLRGQLLEDVGYMGKDCLPAFLQQGPMGDGLVGKLRRCKIAELEMTMCIQSIPSQESGRVTRNSGKLWNRSTMCVMRTYVPG